MWIAQHISVDRDAAELVLDPRCFIKKANFTFSTKFIWLLVRHCLSRTTADNTLTLGRAVLVAAMVAGFEVDFLRMLLEVIHERDFKTSSTYPFPCIIFEFYMSAGVTIWHIYCLKTPTGTVDIALILDEANEVAPNKGPRVEVQPLGENLADMVEHAQGADQYTS